MMVAVNSQVIVDDALPSAEGSKAVVVTRDPCFFVSMFVIM